MTDTDHTTTTDGQHVELDALYRNKPVGQFKGHLFARDDLRAAGVDNGDRADHPAVPICGGKTDRGPFDPISRDELRERAEHAAENPADDDARDLCKRCLDMVARRMGYSGGDPENAPFDPTDYTVHELDRKLGTADAYTDDSLKALRAAEKAGKNRVTAVETIERRITTDL